MHRSLANRGGGEQDFSAAIARFEKARQGFTGAGQYALIFLLDKKIGLIRETLAK